MADMDQPFMELLGTLEEASSAVQEHLNRMTFSQSDDIPAITTLREAVRNFANQADAVFVMMIERDAPEPLMDRAEELVEFFQVAHAQLVVVLQPSQS